MAWNERKHPRHPRKAPGGRGGEFREKADGDWADRISAEIEESSMARIRRLQAASAGDRDWAERWEATQQAHQMWERASRGRGAVEAVPLNEERMDEVADELSSADDDGASWHEFMGLMDAVKGYGYYDYQPVNARLRAGQGDVRAADPSALVPEIRSHPVDDVAAVVGGLDKLMERSELTEDVVVYRALGSHRGIFGGEDADEGIIRADLGPRRFRWTDHAFVSTATERGDVQEFIDNPLATLEADRGGEPVLLEILVPKGVRALHRGERDGDEILLDRGLTFEVYTTHREFGSSNDVAVVKAVVVDTRHGDPR